MKFHIKRNQKWRNKENGKIVTIKNKATGPMKQLIIKEQKGNYLYIQYDELFPNVHEPHPNEVEFIENLNEVIQSFVDLVKETNSKLKCAKETTA